MKNNKQVFYLFKSPYCSDQDDSDELTYDGYLGKFTDLTEAWNACHDHSKSQLLYVDDNGDMKVYAEIFDQTIIVHDVCTRDYVNDKKRQPNNKLYVMGWELVAKGGEKVVMWTDEDLVYFVEPPKWGFIERVKGEYWTLTKNKDYYKRMREEEIDN